MTNTQQQVLSALRYVAVSGGKLIAAANAKAIGGLSPHEVREYIGVYADGERIGNVHVGSIRIRGASIRTLHALAAAGLVSCRDGVWAAIPLRERLCVPMTVGQASIELSKVL